MPDKFDAKIKQRTYIAAPPERVFDVITSAREWDSFFTTGMQLDPKPGGICRFAWQDWGPDFYTLEVDGRVTAVEHPHLFEFVWGPERHKTTVRFELVGAHEGTVMTITEDGYLDTPRDHAAILDCASGWGEASALMKFYIEHNIRYTLPRRK